MFDKFLELFPLQLFFRGLIPGGFFVLSYLVASDGWPKVKGTISADKWLWIGVAVFAGVIIYVLHRALVYPLLEWLMTCTQSLRTNAKCVFKIFRLISKTTCKQLIDYWTIGANEREPENRRDVIIGHHITVWNDYVQLQYASALCIGIGAWCGKMVAGPTANVVRDDALFYLAIIFAASALIGDLRRRTLVDHFLNGGVDLPALYFPKEEKDMK